MNANHHIPQENIIGYIYRTLNDAARETIEAHLVICPICRAKISQHETHQRVINNDIQAQLNDIFAPAKMSFNAIRPRLQKRGMQKILPKLSNTTPMLTAVLGLVLAFFGLWQTMGEGFSLLKVTSSNGAYPALACFFFMFVSMDQFDRSFSIRPRFVFSVVLAVILWLGTFLIGLLNIIVVRDLTIAAYIATGGSPEGASVATIITVLIAAMVYIGVVIGGAEYHYKNIGHPSSWKLFSWTIFIQLFIMILPYLVL